MAPILSATKDVGEWTRALARMNLPQRFFAEMIALAMRRDRVSAVSIMGNRTMDAHVAQIARRTYAQVCDFMCNIWHNKKKNSKIISRNTEFIVSS